MKENFKINKIFAPYLFVEIHSINIKGKVKSSIFISNISYDSNTQK